MKQAFVIFVAAMILVSSMSNAMLFLGFKLNQAEIERRYCINKAEPKKQCHGKCHLTKQLAESNNKKDQPSPLSNFEDSFKITFFHLQLQPTAPETAWTSASLKPVSCNNLISRLFGESLFHPPNNQPLSC